MVSTAGPVVDLPPRGKRSSHHVRRRPRGWETCLNALVRCQRSKLDQASKGMERSGAPNTHFHRSCDCHTRIECTQRPRAQRAELSPPVDSPHPHLWYLSPDDHVSSSFPGAVAAAREQRPAKQASSARD